MTKEEVLNRLRMSREIGTMDNSENWRAAFELFNVATGNRLKPQDRCPKCYQKVLDWLQK